MFSSTDMQIEHDMNLLRSALDGDSDCGATELQVLDTLERHAHYLFTTAIALATVAAHMKDEGVSPIAPFQRRIWMA